jgi:hypothetical protein
MNRVDLDKLNERLRLTLAEDEETVTPYHYAAAIRDCSSLNNSGNMWAELEILKTGECRLHVGAVHTNGQREIPYTTWVYSDSDGIYVIDRYPHT